MSVSPFHLSVPVTDLTSARAFYGDMLGCREGRSDVDRVDFDFFGHHLVTHVEPVDASHETTVVTSAGIPTPCRHFGVILPKAEWDAIAERLRAARIEFFMEPQVIFPGEVKEQAIMLVSDGSGNIVELKSQPAERIFATKL